MNGKGKQRTCKNNVMTLYFTKIWFIGSVVNVAILATVSVAKVSAANSITRMVNECGV